MFISLTQSKKCSERYLMCNIPKKIITSGCHFLKKNWWSVMEDNLRGWRDAVFLHTFCIGRYTKDEKWIFCIFFSGFPAL